MKKQTKPSLFAGGKLTLGKITISNLSNADMKRQIGGGSNQCTKHCTRHCGGGCTTEMSGFTSYRH